MSRAGTRGRRRNGPARTTAAAAPVQIPTLSREARAAFTRELFRFHVEELNGLGDRLAYAAAQQDAAGLAHARAQCRTVVEALRWDPDAARLSAELAADEPELPEDLFAPLLLLAELAPGDAATEGALASASEPVRTRLSLFRVPDPGPA